jgi:ATP-binding cassette subfamily B (MDR/TAP) protein 1
MNSSDVNKVKDGFSDKLGRALVSASTIISGFLIAFYEGWLLTLVILSLSPLIVLSIGLFGAVNLNLRIN